MSPSASGSNFISLDKAIAMTKRYRAQKSTVLAPGYENVLLYCETFDRTAFDALLAEPDCVSVRVYFGMDEKLTVKVIAVGVNESNEDILPSGNEEVEGGPGRPIVEEGSPCPTNCPPPSPLSPP